MIGPFEQGAGGAPLDRRYARVSQLPRVVTALPANPNDGDRIRYKFTNANTNSGNSGYWEFVYDAADAYWYPTTRSPLRAFTAAAVATAASGTYQTLLGDPQLTLPFAGDYDVAVGAFLLAGNVPAAQGAIISISFNGSTPLDANGAQFNHTANLQGSHISKELTQTSLVAGGTIIARCKGAAANPATYLDRFLTAYPVRVH